MNETTLRMRKTLAFMMIWVLLFNNIPMLNWVVNAQESGNVSVSDNGSVTGGDVTGGDYEVINKEYISFSDDKFAVSVGDSDWQKYDYKVLTSPVKAIYEDGMWDISDCDFPCSFEVLRTDKNSNEAKLLKFKIEGLHTKLEFTAVPGKEHIYGTAKSVEISAEFDDDAMKNGREITYTVVDLVTNEYGEEVESNNSQIAYIKKENGKNILVFNDGQVGKIRIKASVGKSGKYAESKIEHDVQIVNEAKPEEQPKYHRWTDADGWVEVEENAIYDHILMVKPPTGYELLMDNKIEGHEKKTYNRYQEGVYEKAFYLRNKTTGGITEAYSVVVDKTGPQIIKAEYSQWFGGEKKKKDNYGNESTEYIYGTYIPMTEKNNEGKPKYNYEYVTLYYNEAVNMTFTIDESDLKKVEAKIYRNGNECTEEIRDQNDKKEIITYSIPYNDNPNESVNYYVVKIKLTDNVGNITNYTSETICLLPRLTYLSSGYFAYDEFKNGIPKRVDYYVLVEGENGQKKESYSWGGEPNAKVYFNESFSMWFPNSFNNPNLHILTASKNGIVHQPMGSGVNNAYGVVGIADEGEYKITIYNTINKENQLIETLIYDKTPPSIEATYEGERYLVKKNGVEKTLPNNYENGKDSDYEFYYEGDVNLKFTITEPNLSEIIFKDSYYTDDNQPTVEWTREGDKWIAEYKIEESKEGDHQIIITAKDKLGYETTFTSEHLMIEREKAKLDRKVYTPWLTSNDIIGVPGYSAPDKDYVAGDDENVKLYYNGDMEMTFYIKKKKMDTNCITFKDSTKADPIQLEWTKVGDENSDIWKATYKIAETELGEHIITLKYQYDEEYDINWTSEKINIIDTTLPKINEVKYSGIKRVENADGSEPENVNATQISEEMKVFANGDLWLFFDVEEANIDDIKKLVLVDNGVAIEHEVDEWYTLPDNKKEWYNPYRIPSARNEKHRIILKYVAEDSTETVLWTSAEILMDNIDANLDNVTYTVTDGNSVGVEPENDKAPHYYNQNVEITFELKEGCFQDNYLSLTDSYPSNSSEGIEYSVRTDGDKNYITYLIPEEAEGVHNVSLLYTDKGSNINVTHNTCVIIDTTPPEAGEIAYSEPIFSLDNTEYFAADENNAKITFEITEANFHKEGLELQVSFLPEHSDEWETYTIDKDQLVCSSEEGTDKVRVVYTISAGNFGTFVLRLKYDDPCKNGNGIQLVTNNIVMDRAAQGLAWIYDDKTNTVEKDEKLFCKVEDEEFQVGIAFSEDNFAETGLTFTDSFYGDENIDLDWNISGENSNIVSAVYKIPKSAEGEHILHFNYQSVYGNGNIDEDSKPIIIDSKPAEIEVMDYSEAKYIDNEILYYNKKSEAKVSFKINEKNFDSTNLKIIDNYDGRDIEIDANIDYTKEPIEATCIVPNDKEGVHQLTISYNATSGLSATMKTKKMIIDNIPAVKGEVTYSGCTSTASSADGTIRYYKGSSNTNDYVEVTFDIIETNFHQAGVKVLDNGVENPDINVRVGEVENGNTYPVKCYIPKTQEGTHVITLTYQDRCGNGSPITFTTDQIVVDSNPPIILALDAKEAYDTTSASFKRMVDANDNAVSVPDGTTRFIYQDAMTFRLEMEEINFDASKVVVTVYRDEVEVKNGDGYQYASNKNWNTDANTPNIHKFSLELGKKDGKLIDGNYQVKMEYTDRAGNPMAVYTSNVITIDSDDPDIQITYDNNTANNGSYYNKNRVATITITDRNVNPDDIIVSVTAKDIDGNVVPFNLKTKQSAWSFNKSTNVWTGKITYDVDANYEVVISGIDMASNAFEKKDSFTVDKTAPSKDNFRFEYSTAIADKGKSNNIFYKDKVTIKIIAEDVTSPIDYFEWAFIKQSGASSVNKDAENHIIRNSASNFTYDANKRTATAEITLTADQVKQYRGNLRFKATDMAGNTSEELTDTDRIIIVDTIAPTRAVTYSPASQIINENTLNTLSGFDYSSENAGVVLLYNAPMTVTFKVNEANFYAEDMIVKVNDAEVKVNNWSKDGDEWTGSISFVDNGEYVVKLKYADRSTNAMVDYVSHKIIIDTVKPQIQVSYSPDDVKQQLEGIKYYDKQQTANITITERNFRADDVEVIVKAKDVNGNEIKVTDYFAYLKNRSNWSNNGDVHTAQITFSADANYEFDIQYKDLALISADDYVNDVFTVDQTPPENVTVSYSTPVAEKNMQGTEYEYYNEPIVVTITAEDGVSGIHSFDFNYIRAEGTSSANGENVSNKIEAQKITYTNGKKTATATFLLPASELRAGTQINGKVDYIAYNKSLLSTEYKDSKRYIVDNLSPNVTVEFNEAVQNANNTSYYADDITVNITVDEANFYEEDVKVSVSKDGGEQKAVEVSWRTASADRHVGTFTLSEEGDYKIFVSYQDPSTNQMGDYESNKLTIDKTKPTARVTGIRNKSANKNKTVGFVVTVEDTNLDTEGFTPRLMAEIRDDSGEIKEVDCTDIGKVEVVMDGQGCTYTITNIEQDGIYRFKSWVTDMSGNVTEDMVVEGIVDQTVSVLEFSINRNGSTYGLDETTKALNNSVVKEAKDIVVYETNPDEIKNIKITLFKNDKTIILVEGKDYVVNRISEDGEWYKYEYVIFASNFIEDGTYRISIYSEDKAGNVAENNLDVKNVEINFGVDKTLPNLIVTNLESKTTYPLEKLSVLMQATDNMRLVNVTVELDGKVIATWDEEQIRQMSSNLQDFVFDIMGDTTQAHTVIITLTDIAGNQRVETISDFYVTTNLWVRFINNKVLFYGSIMSCLLVGVSIVPLWKRRKKRREARG
ncbi:MAG: hypothetical protein IKK33_06570 [Lachnospiraceae bacterium]|nr:hypothetical protein [Lachnospiraceae bacterium]